MIGEIGNVAISAKQGNPNIHRSSADERSSFSRSVGKANSYGEKKIFFPIFLIDLSSFLCFTYFPAGFSRGMFSYFCFTYLSAMFFGQWYSGTCFTYSLACFLCHYFSQLCFTYLSAMFFRFWFTMQFIGEFFIHSARLFGSF